MTKMTMGNKLPRKLQEKMQIVGDNNRRHNPYRVSPTAIYMTPLRVSAGSTRPGFHQRLFM